MQQYGKSWFERLLKQNPRWVRGTRTPDTILADKNSTWAASFTSDGLFPTSSINISHPIQGSFVTWFQLAAIPKDAPHPEAAKLLLPVVRGQSVVMLLLQVAILLSSKCPVLTSHIFVSGCQTAAGLRGLEPGLKTSWDLPKDLVRLSMAYDDQYNQKLATFLYSLLDPRIKCTIVHLSNFDTSKELRQHQVSELPLRSSYNRCSLRQLSAVIAKSSTYPVAT
jgi:hypothetical protein